MRTITFRLTFTLIFGGRLASRFLTDKFAASQNASAACQIRMPEPAAGICFGIATTRATNQSTSNSRRLAVVWRPLPVMTRSEISRPTRTAPRWLRWAALLALAGYAVFLARNAAVVAGGSDSSGYLNSARLFAQGRLVEDLRAPAEFGPKAALVPMHFMPQGFFFFGDRTKLTPTYPSGLPLHFALAGKLLGWELGPWLVILAAAIGAVALCYLVACELGVSIPLATAGAVTLAAFPVFIFTSIQPLSDTIATTWTLGMLYAALRSREKTGWALACGAALAMAVLVRPTNLVLAPAALALFGFNGKKIALFGLGGIPGAAWLAYYNHRLYGGALKSGYGDVYAAFAWTYGVPSAIHFAKWLALLLPAALLALPLLAWARREQRTRGLTAVTLLFVAVAGLYLFYEVSHEVWWCLRFILPAVPALICAGLLGAEVLAKQSEKMRGVFAAVLVAWALAIASFWTPRLDVFMMKQYEQAYADGAIAAREKLPRNALVTSFAFSGSLYFYSDFPVLRWDQIDPPVFANYVALAQKSGRPICAVLFDWEEKDAFRRCPGDWTRLTTVRNVGLWQLAAPKS